MNSVMDIMFSMIIVAVLLLSAMQLDFNVKASAIRMRHDLDTQENAKSFAEIIEWEFRKIGHRLERPHSAISFADSRKIAFSYNKSMTGAYDSVYVEYGLSTGVDESAGGNRANIHFYRLENKKEQSIALGVKDFLLCYYNESGRKLPNPVPADSLSKIREIEVALTMKSKESIDGQYSYSTYRTRITPKNLLIKFSY
jgi:hypothetical protein